jgi:multisubunit Na+/H+ antiporter MnhB subunit
VLTVLVGVQAPAMILVAGYLLWSGADAPGGAFQAGAVLAAAAVMLALGDRHAPRHLRGLPLRAGLAFGLAAFLGAGILGALIGDAFLAYPPHLAAAMVFCIEIAAAISIGLVLFDIFASVLRRRAGTGSTPGEGSR